MEYYVVMHHFAIKLKNVRDVIRFFENVVCLKNLVLNINIIIDFDNS